MNQQEAESVKDLAKPTNDVLEKLGWKWEPKVGEFVLIDNQPVLVNYVWPNGDSRGIELEYGPHDYIGYSKELTPILHWETIERVLEGVGYRLYLTQHSCAILRYNLETKCDIDREPLVKALGESRQEAVTQSVIKLGKELK